MQGIVVLRDFLCWLMIFPWIGGRNSGEEVHLLRGCDVTTWFIGAVVTETFGIEAIWHSVVDTFSTFLNFVGAQETNKKV